MKINSKNLWDYIFNIVTNKKAKFKVYFDDTYVTEILWNGESFEWESGAFTSGAFFNPLCDFEIIEENKKIEKLPTVNINNETMSDLEIYLRQDENCLIHKINELIDAVNELKDSDN